MPACVHGSVPLALLPMERKMLMDLPHPPPPFHPLTFFASSFILGTHLYPLKSNNVEDSCKPDSWCNRTQELRCCVCLMWSVSAELCFHIEDVCMFQTPFRCGPKGFGGVWVEVRKLDSKLVSMCDDVCVLAGEQAVYEGVVKGKWKGRSTRMKSIRSLVRMSV